MNCQFIRFLGCGAGDLDSASAVGSEQDARVGHGWGAASLVGVGVAPLSRSETLVSARGLVEWRAMQGRGKAGGRCENQRGGLPVAPALIEEREREGPP